MSGLITVKLASERGNGNKDQEARKKVLESEDYPFLSSRLEFCTSAFYVPVLVQ